MAKYTVEDEITRVVGAMESIDPVSDDYQKIAKNLEVLAKVQTAKSSSRVSPDTIVTAIVTILEIVLVLQHENLGNVISSKAFGFVKKF